MDNLKVIPKYLEQLMSLPVEVQYELAKRLATNCGYKLEAEDNERSLQIKTIITRMTSDGPAVVDEGDRDLIKAGLEKLL